MVPKNILAKLKLGKVFLIATLCTMHLSCKRSSNPRDRVLSGRDSIKERFYTIPLIEFTSETPPEKKEALCSPYKQLLKATCLNDPEGLLKLIDYDPEGKLTNEQNEYGWTALMWASRNNQEENLDILLALENIKVNLEDKAKRNALSYAATHKGSFTVISKIISHSSPEQLTQMITTSDAWGDNALSLSYKIGQLEGLDLLLANGAPVNDGIVLHEAAQRGDLASIKKLAEHNLLPNLVNADGYTPLTLAAYNGHLDVVEFLIDQLKADYNLPDKFYYMTPLMAAVGNGHLEIVKNIVQRPELNVNYRHPINGKTVLGLAVQNHFYEIAEILKSIGATL